MKKKISLAEAKERVKKYRENAQKNTTNIKLPNCVDFDLATITNIINSHQVKGVRAYFTQIDDNQVSLFLVGYNEAGEDVLSHVAESGSKTLLKAAAIDGEVDDPIRMCPPDCTKGSY